MRYPTPEEILDAPVDFRQETIDTVEEWKEQCFNKHWSKLPNEQKMYWIGTLISRLSIVYKDKIKPPEISAYPKADCMYDTIKYTIHLNSDHPSIISAFHEFCHHLYGSSEFKACRWSIWLFKTCFPRESLKLKFKGHLLVK